MGLFSRIINLIRGWLGLKVSQLEEGNSAIVYENAIRKKIEDQVELKKAAAGIVQLKKSAEAKLTAKEKEYAEISAYLETALEEGEDELAIQLIEQKQQLEIDVAEAEKELESSKADAEKVIKTLNAFRADIEKLQAEKKKMIAKEQTAAVKIKIQEQLNGLSVDADVQALENVRNHIHNKVAQAEIGDELEANSTTAALDRIKAKTGNVQARAELDRLKKLRAAKKESAKNMNLKKTI